MSDAHRPLRLTLLTWLAVAGAVYRPAPAAAAEPLRVFISVDMEGIGGVVTGEQLGTSGFEYQRFRERMTEETNAAIEAARGAGATRIVVADSHGNFQNLLLEKLPADVEVVRGTPRPLGMLQGIDEGFDAVVFVGYHASTSNPEGVRAHTFSSATLADVRLNGASVTEGAFNAALAAHFGAKAVAVSGDAAAVAEVQAQVKGIEGAVVKWGYAFHAARVLSPEASRAAIRAAVTKGLARRAEIPLHAIEGPIELELRFKNYRPAEVMAWLPGVTRVDSHAVRYTARDVVEAYRLVTFVLTFQSALEP
jgi:D-amino peptidase